MEEEKGASQRHLGLPENAENAKSSTEAENAISLPRENGKEGHRSSELGEAPTEPISVKIEAEESNKESKSKNGDQAPADTDQQLDVAIDQEESRDVEAEKIEGQANSSPVVNFTEILKEEDQLSEGHLMVDASVKPENEISHSPVQKDVPNKSIFDPPASEGNDSGTEEEQAAFMRELESFFKERSLEFKPPKFYGEGLNCLKLWRAVTRLGGYEQVTSCKLWRQVGESFKPPKTCTTVSWSFRCFYEKALLEYEKHKIRSGELQVPVSSIAEPVAVDSQAGNVLAPGSGRQRRDAAARAMQGWHSQKFLGNGEISSPVIKEKSPASLPRRDKHIKSIGVFKRKKPSNVESSLKSSRMKIAKPQMDSLVVDVGDPADWVKINVRRTKDCFEIYALVPGLLREEVHVQSDPAGRLVVSGQPEQPDNPWGVTPFKKVDSLTVVITLPSRIDPHQTSAVVTLHGQLFIRAPFEQL